MGRLRNDEWLGKFQISYPELLIVSSYLAWCSLQDEAAISPPPFREA